MADASLPPSGASGGTPAAGVTTLSLKPGDTVDAYTVVDTIATTGSAVVYKAHDGLLDRHVAVKQIILGSEDSDEALRKRIRDEAAIHKRVSTTQPKHLIQFIDAVDDPRGLMLVSEYYPSTSLEDLLDRQRAPLDERQALGIVAATALGLRAIHDAGVVHRDLKPSNILLGEDGGLKICDFGLAALIESQDSLSLGSVRYMAPELLRSETADGRADVYSLGVIAYEMLAGRPNFDAAFRNVLRDQRNQAMRWMKWHTNARVAAPLLDEFLPDLPPHLTQLVARMMDKDVARRVGRADDVVEAIRRHFTGDTPDDLSPDPASAYPAAPATTTPGDTAPLPDRSRLPMILAGLLGFWVIVGAVLFGVSEQRAAAAREAALVQADDDIARGNAYYEDADYAAALLAYRGVTERFDPDTTPGQRAQRGLLKTRGRIALAEARYDDAVEHFEAYRVAGGRASNVETLIGQARVREAFAEIERGVEAKVAAAAFTEAQQIVRDARQQQWTDAQLLGLDELEASVVSRRDSAIAQRRIAEARELADAGDRPAAIAALVDLVRLPPEGQALLAELEEAEALAQAMARGEEAVRTGRLADAVEAFTQAQTIRPDDELAARIRDLDVRRLTQEAAALLDAGEYEAAGVRLTAALNLAPDDEDAKRVRTRLGAATALAVVEQRADAAAAAGNLDGAVAGYEEALELDPTNTRIATKLNNLRLRRNLQLARRALDGDRLPQARALLEEAQLLAPDDASLVPLLEELDTLERYRALLAEAEAALAVDDFRKAKQLVRDAGKLKPGNEVDDRMADVDFRSFLSLGRQYLDEGELEAARAILNQARNIRPASSELITLLEAIERAEDDRDLDDSASR